MCGYPRVRHLQSQHVNGIDKAISVFRSPVACWKVKGCDVFSEIGSWQGFSRRHRPEDLNI
jgi:hypothetical protein